MSSLHSERQNLLKKALRGEWGDQTEFLHNPPDLLRRVPIRYSVFATAPPENVHTELAAQIANQNL